jgi:hypothetical protein
MAMAFKIELGKAIPPANIEAFFIKSLRESICYLD